MSISVAVVENNDEVSDAIRLALEHQGWTIRTYATGEAFLADINSYEPDCVILDPHLPRLNGAEVARQLAHSTRIPFVGLSARPDSSNTRELADIGAHSILTKPAKVEELVAHVEAAIASARGDTQ